MTLQGSVAVHGNRSEWPETVLRSFLRQTDRTGEVDLPLLGVGLYAGVRERDNNDGRPAASEDLSGYKIVQAGDVVMNRLGKPHGSVGVSPARGITSPAYWVMEIDRNRAYPPFVHHLLRSKHMVREYERLGKYMPPNQFDISWDAFRSIEVPLPPLDEQRRIADVLDAETATVDDLVSAISKSSNLLQAKRRVLLMSAFPNHSCTAYRLGYYLDLVTSGPRGWGDYVGSRGTPFFRSANLRRDEIEPNLEDLALVDPPLSAAVETARSRVRIGDVLIGITGANTGWVSLADKMIAQANVSQHVCLVRPGNKIDGCWLAYALSAPQVQELLLGSQYGGTKTQLSLGDIRNLVMPLPSLDEQHGIVASIAAGLAAVTAERELRDRQLTLLYERRQTLITAAVTGGIAV
jgi:type I restriction enzyme S subunit